MNNDNKSHVIDSSGFVQLIDAISEAGYEVIGPTVRDGTIVYDRIEGASDLPVGWSDEQNNGSYRLRRRDDEATFGFVVGQNSLKSFLFPPSLQLWNVKKNGTGWDVDDGPEELPKYAFIGVRACEIQAVAIQDRVFLGDKYPDPHYKARRESTFIVAVNCTEPGGTCFCVSMNSGPRASSGYDISLTEVVNEDSHYYVVETGTERGDNILQQVPHGPASTEQVMEADSRLDAAEQQMGRTMDTDGIKGLLYDNYEHTQWGDVASRCLSCTNCTMVCPTCFCSTTEEMTSLDGQEASRSRRWDSCFTDNHSLMHGGAVRSSGKSRYRQWMTHKLGTWIDQFGTSGCVGCGRCITWCPVGIDITAEIAAIRATQVEV